MQEFRTDAIIKADAARDILHIGADLFAQIRHFIDEGDLGRQKRIGGIFDEFGCAATREEKWRLIEIERAIDFTHHFACALCFSADHNAVRPLEIRDSGTFAQEFRIGDNRKVQIGTGFANDLFDFITRAHRHS